MSTPEDEDPMTREDFARELEVGAAELARQDEQIAEQRRRIEQLRRRIRKLERLSEQRRLRLQELEDDLAFYTGSRPVRQVARLVRAIRRHRGGST
jgi:chromosome segregation ATPase